MYLLTKLPLSVDTTDTSEMNYSEPCSWVVSRDQPKSPLSDEEVQTDDISHLFHPSVTLTKLIKCSGISASKVQSCTYV